MSTLRPLRSAQTTSPSPLHALPSAKGASRRARPLFPAISVQFRAEPPPPLQLSTPKVCIACAGMRLARIYADDAQEMLLAERLVGEARQRRARRMDQRERVITGVSACAYLAVAIAIALLVPDERHVAPVVVFGLLCGYALILQVRFEFGGYYASPEQLAFIPLLLIAPLPYVPLLFAAAGVLAAVPDITRNSWHSPSLAQHLLGLMGGARWSHRPRRLCARRLGQRLLRDLCRCLRSSFPDRRHVDVAQEPHARSPAP